MLLRRDKGGFFDRFRNRWMFPIAAENGKVVAREIADKLSIGEGTVKSHLHSIYEKLGVHGRVELTMYAYERGII